jgi:hypothetical protein
MVKMSWYGRLDKVNGLVRSIVGLFIVYIYVLSIFTSGRRGVDQTCKGSAWYVSSVGE